MKTKIRAAANKYLATVAAEKQRRTDAKNKETREANERKEAEKAAKLQKKAVDSVARAERKKAKQAASQPSLPTVDKRVTAFLHSEDLLHLEGSTEGRGRRKRKLDNLVDGRKVGRLRRDSHTNVLPPAEVTDLLERLTSKIPIAVPDGRVSCSSSDGIPYHGPLTPLESTPVGNRGRPPKKRDAPAASAQLTAVQVAATQAAATAAAWKAAAEVAAAKADALVEAAAREAALHAAGPTPTARGPAAPPFAPEARAVSTTASSVAMAHVPVHCIPEAGCAPLGQHTLATGPSSSIDPNPNGGLSPSGRTRPPKKRALL
jgi:hypothetical protein